VGGLDLTGKAAVLKTAGRNPVEVRILCPPSRRQVIGKGRPSDHAGLISLRPRLTGPHHTGKRAVPGVPGLETGLRPRGEGTPMQAVTLFGYAFLSNVALAVLPHEPAVIWYGARLGVWPTTLVATAGTVA